MATFSANVKVKVLTGVVLSAVGVLALLYVNAPELTSEERVDFKLPRSIEDAKRLGLLLSKYKDEHYYTVMFGVAAVYVLLQSFAIPGSIFLTILSGYLFPFLAALVLVCTCSACGALVCYFLSHLLGRQLVMMYIPEHVQNWQKEIASVDGYLIFHMIFLRVTPILPNWFINIASPIIGIPAHTFFFGTFIGVAPPSFIFLQAGTTLQMLAHTGAVWSWTSISAVAGCAVLSLLPIMYQQYSKYCEKQKAL